MLGWESIEVNELQCDTLTAQLAEIDENLCRSELTPTQEAEHLAKRKEVWEAMRAVERADDLAGSTGGATCATGRNSDGTFGEGQEGFAASTEKVTGKDKSTINRAIGPAQRGAFSCVTETPASSLGILPANRIVPQRTHCVTGDRRGDA